MLLNKKTVDKKVVVIEGNADSVDNFFEKAANLHKKNQNFKKNVATCLLRAMIVKSKWCVKCKKRIEVLDFFR